MFNFNATTLIHVLWLLDFYERTPLTPKPRIAGVAAGLLEKLPTDELSDFDKENGKQIIDATTNLANSLGGLRSTKHRISEFGRKLRFSITGSEYKNEIKVLREALEFDLSECMFYHYPADRFEVLRRSADDWMRVKKAFPEVAVEALIAYDCYALKQHTASVFHIMRVAERGLRALAKERRIKLPKNKLLDWATWQEIISALNLEATKIGQKARAGAAKDNALSFYSGAIADLNAFKDEYRNQVMHVRKDYDEQQTLRALVKVHGFMDRLSERIDHSHNRIRWGLKFKTS